MSHAGFDGAMVKDSTASLTYQPGGQMYGGRRRTLKAKTLRRLLKKRGLKTTGRKSTLTKRAKKAHLLGGAEGLGVVQSSPGLVTGGRHRRKRRGGGAFGDSGGTYPFNAGDVGTGSR